MGWAQWKGEKIPFVLTGTVSREGRGPGLKGTVAKTHRHERFKNTASYEVCLLRGG